MDLDSPFIIERDLQRSVPAKQPATAINSKDQQKDSDGAGCLQSSHFPGAAAQPAALAAVSSQYGLENTLCDHYHFH